MDTQHIETVIIGAGQAGLATGYHLQRRGRPFVILEGNQRVGDGWRQQWDTLRLYSPARFDALPGMPFPAPPFSYPGKDEVADYFEAYAARLDLPIRLGTRVERVTAREGGGYVVTTGTQRLEADNVVIATGTFGRAPLVPSFADQLDPGIRQLHSSEYRRPEQLREGPVLVVGASHSGGDIAYEVALSHPTVLCGRDTGELPIRLGSPSARLAFPVVLFLGRHVITRRTPIGRHAKDEIRFHGGPLLRVKRRDLANRGVERVTERVVGVEGGRPVLAGGRVVEATNVVWCTGFQQSFDWVDLPVFDDHGWPEEERGVVAKAPGLFFCGLAFQYAFSSMLIAGASRDAGYVAKRIDQRRRAVSQDRETPATASTAAAA
jgi:putative flavoprotein involved in K+ transport